MGNNIIKKLENPAFLGNGDGPNKEKLIYFYSREESMSLDEKYNAFMQVIQSDPAVEKAIIDSEANLDKDDMCSPGGFFDTLSEEHAEKIYNAIIATKT